MNIVIFSVGCNMKFNCSILIKVTEFFALGCSEMYDYSNWKLPAYRKCKVALMGCGPSGRPRVDNSADRSAKRYAKCYIIRLLSMQL